MCKLYVKYWASLCLISSLTFLGFSPLTAQTIFSGAVSSDFTNPANWSGGVPSLANPGTIPGGATCNINSALTINFSLTSYGTININAAVTVSGTLNNYTGSDCNIGAAGKLVNNGTMDQRGSLDIVAGGQFTSTGNYSSVGTAVINNDGTVSLAGSFSNFGTVNNTGSLTITGGSIGNNTSFINNGTCTLSGGTFTNFNGANIENATGKTLTHNTSATLNNQGTLTNNGTYACSGVLTNNATVINNGTFNNAGGSITNSFRVNNFGTFNHNAGSFTNGFELNNGGTFNNNFILENNGQVNNLATGQFNNAAVGKINNNFGALINNANIFGNIGEIQSVGGIINTGTFANAGSIYTNTGGNITTSGNFVNNNLLNNLEQIINTGIFTNNGQLQNNSGGVFTNNGDLYNAQPARIANDYNIVNNQNLYNNGTIENGVRVFNNAYFENNGYLLNIGDFLNEVTGVFKNTHNSTTQGSNGGVLENTNGGVFMNKGTINNYDEIFNLECSSFINYGTINNYYWWTNHSLFFNYGTFNELPYGQMNMDGGVEITGPTSTEVCQNATVAIGANGSVTITGAVIATAAYDDCTTLTLKVNDSNTVTFTCADIGTKTVKLTISDRIGTKVDCNATVTIVDNIAPAFNNCPTDIVVVGTGATTNVTWTAPTATDNCGPVNVTSTHVPGSGFAVGTTTVTYNAIDGHGNGAVPCTFNVIVVPPGDCADVVSVNKVNSTATNCGAGTAYAMWLNNQYYTAGNDLIFIQYANGTAQLVGSVFKGASRAYVEVLLSGKTTTAPSGSPKYELCVNSGAGSWTYYTSMDGSITLDDCRVLGVKRFGPSFQMGMGGNLQDKTLQGASGWFSCNGGTTHNGDFNFRLGDAIQCHNSIYLEAECATVGSNWQIRTDALASNGKVLLPPNANSFDNPPTSTADLVTFNVNVSVAGYYRLFARTIVPNGSGDSYWVRVNNGNWVKWNTVNYPAYNGYQWDQVGDWDGCEYDVPVSFQLVAGANTIQFSWREANACLDKLYLTLTGKKPTGLGGNATNCGNNGGGSGDPFDGKFLCLKARHSGKSADVSGASNYSGTKLVQWDGNGNDNQKFLFTKVGASTYTITAKHSGKCLDATSNCYAGSRVVQNPCDGTNSQKWVIEDAGSGYYLIKNVSSGLYMDVSGASTSNGAEIILWSKHGGNNQQWSIGDCGNSTPPPAPCNKKALFVVGNTWLCSSDAAVKRRLEDLGYTVTLKDDGACNTNDGNDKGLIVISSTCNSSNVGYKYRDINVPVITWESYIFDDMKMTGNSVNSHYGTCNNVSKLRVTDSSHPICAGATGDFTIFNCGKTINWGNPGTGAKKVACVPGFNNWAMIFTYDAGHAMVGMNAPARRCGFYFDTDNADNCNNTGWLIFDRTVQWASGCDLGVRAEAPRQDLLELTAQRSNQMVNLYWKNNTGFKNENFTIEKSTDGVNWEVLAEQDAYRNEDESTNLFEELDFSPVIGKNYYRVTVTYLDGTTQSSDIQTITINDIAEFEIYPNPASTTTNLNLESLVGERNVTVRIFDWMGRQVDLIKIDEVFDAQYTLDLQQHATGRYSVEVSSETKRPVAKKLIISK